MTRSQQAPTIRLVARRAGETGFPLAPTQLKLFELVQSSFHPRLLGVRHVPADPMPALHQKSFPLPVGFEVEGGYDSISNQNWANEIAKYSLVFGNVSLEAIVVIEKESQSLTLDDQRVEGGEDMNLFSLRIGNGVEGVRMDPVQQLACSFHLHWDQLFSTNSRFHQNLHR